MGRNKKIKLDYKKNGLIEKIGHKAIIDLPCGVSVRNAEVESEQKFYFPKSSFC